MAIKQRKKELVENSIVFKLMGKRFADLSPEEKKIYRRKYKKYNRTDNPTLRAKETAYTREWRRRKRDAKKESGN